MTVRLSAAVMAHPARRGAAEALAARLGGVPVVYDTNPVPSADPAQRWATGARAWAAYDPAADWHLVIQDDVTVCRDLLPGVARLLSGVRRRAVVSLYLGDRPAVEPYDALTRAADEAGAGWVRGARLIWGPAIAAPVAAIPAMLAACEHRAEPYDTRLGLYFARQGYPAYYTWPSLADHAAGPSLLGHPDGRHARRFVGADASALNLILNGRVAYARGVTRRRNVTVGLEHPDLLVARRSAVLRHNGRRTVVQGGQTTAARDAEIVAAHPGLWEPLTVDYPSPVETADAPPEGTETADAPPAPPAAPVEAATAAPGEKRTTAPKTGRGKAPAKSSGSKG